MTVSFSRKSDLKGEDITGNSILPKKSHENINLKLVFGH